MRWTLRAKLALGLAGIVTAIMGVSLLSLTMSTRGHLIEDYRRFAIHLSDVALAGLENAMISRNPAEISSVLQAIDHREGYRGLLIVDKRGEIKHSTNATHVGRVLSNQGDPACRVCHDRPPSVRPQTVILPSKDGGRILRVARPLLNQPRCQGCHQERVLGMLVADLSLAEPDRLMAAALWKLFLWVLVTIVGVIGGAIGFVHQTVTRPVGHFLRVTQAIGAGDLKRRVALTRGDEIGELAASFDQMVERIAVSEAENARLYEEAQAQRTRLTQIFDSVNDAIISADSSGSIIAWNQGAQSIFGYREDEAVGKPLTLLMPDRYRDAYRRGLERLRSTGESDVVGKTVELHGLRKDGSEFPLELCLTSWNTGGATFYSGIIRDITERKRAEEALRESEERFRGAFDSAAIGMALVAPDGRWLQVNRSLCEIVGYSEQELLATTFQAITHPDDLETDLDYVRQMLAGEIRSYQMEKRYFHKRGHVVWILLSVSLVRDAAGSPLYFVGQIQDITERKRAEAALRASEERTRLMIDKALDAVVTIDTEGVVTGWNPQAEAIFGWPRQEIIGRPLTDTIMPARYREAHRRGLQHFLATGEGPVLNQTVEFTASHRDGHEFPLEVSVWPVKSGDTVTFSAFARDITERKRVEAELQRAKRAAEAATCAKSEFLANMSHEIRTPLNGIIGMADLALDTPLSAEQREYLDMVKSSADSLLTVINDILDFSKIEAGRLDFDRIDFSLRDCLDEAMKALIMRAHQKGLALAIEVRPDVPDVVGGDPGRLRQIITNLVGNAIKFTERGGVTITVKREAEGVRGHSPCTRHGAPDSDIASPLSPSASQCLLHFSVRDTGIGIPAEKQQAIFNAFEQGDGSTARKYGGTGLGLTISSKLVRLMGGRIWVESEVGTGATFHFTAQFGLPEHGPAEQVVADLAAVPAPREAAPGKPRHILLAEDNAVNQKLVTRLLTKRGHTVVVVGTGREALAALEKEHFDLVLMDVQMPEMDGLEATAEIRSRESKLRTQDSESVRKLVARPV